MVSRTSKSLSLVALMAALGNVLSFLSIQLTPIAPSVPLGPVTMGLAFDLSHLATFITALIGGPIAGALTGAVGGFVAAFEFGFSKGNIITGIALPLGKLLTGLFAGLIIKRIDPVKLKALIVTTVSYIPEAIFTFLIFYYLFPIYFALPQSIAVIIAIQILIKAFIEMILIGIIISGLLRSKSFNAYISNYQRN